MSPYLPGTVPPAAPPPPPPEDAPEAVWMRLPAALCARVDAEVARRRRAAGLPDDAGSPSRAAVLRALVEAGLDAVAEQETARLAVSRSARRAV